MPRAVVECSFAALFTVVGTYSCGLMRVDALLAAHDVQPVEHEPLVDRVDDDPDLARALDSRGGGDLVDAMHVMLEPVVESELVVDEQVDGARLGLVLHVSGRRRSVSSGDPTRRCRNRVVARARRGERIRRALRGQARPRRGLRVLNKAGISRRFYQHRAYRARCGGTRAPGTNQSFLPPQSCSSELLLATRVACPSSTKAHWVTSACHQPSVASGSSGKRVKYVS